MTVKAPPIRTNIWSMSVYSTARSPPSNVYTPVARITTNAPRPEVDPHEGLENDPARGNRHRDLGQDVSDDGDNRQIPPRGRRVTPLHELRHRKNPAPQVKRNEEPTQRQEHEAGLDLELAHRNASCGPGTGKADQVLGADVGCKQRCADDEPAGVASAEKVVPWRVARMRAMGRAIGNRKDGHEIHADNRPVQCCECWHCGFAIFPGSRRWSQASPAGISC